MPGLEYFETGPGIIPDSPGHWGKNHIKDVGHPNAKAHNLIAHDVVTDIIQPVTKVPPTHPPVYLSANFPWSLKTKKPSCCKKA